jgi:hypothetical protein
VTQACRRCGRETWSSRSPYCREHRPPPEQRRLWAAKSREARGYGRAHKAQRERWARVVEAGAAVCARCGRPIVAGTAWDLGHSADRSGWTGPEHASCNRATSRHRVAQRTMLADPGWTGLRTSTGMRVSQEW